MVVVALLSLVSLMSEEPIFTEAQQGSIGVGVTQLDELLQALRGFGVASPLLGELQVAIGELEAATGARRPVAPTNRVPVALAQMRVLAEELRPRRMANYGVVTLTAAAILDARVGRLVELLDALGSEQLGSAGE